MNFNSMEREELQQYITENLEDPSLLGSLYGSLEGVALQDALDHYAKTLMHTQGRALPLKLKIPPVHEATSTKDAGQRILELEEEVREQAIIRKDILQKLVHDSEEEIAAVDQQILEWLATHTTEEVLQGAMNFITGLIQPYDRKRQEHHIRTYRIGMRTHIQKLLFTTNDYMHWNRDHRVKEYSPERWDYTGTHNTK